MINIRNNNNCGRCVLLLWLLFCFNPYCVNAIFIQLFNNTYAFEFKVNVTTTDQNGKYVTNIDDYAPYYSIDNVCTELKTFNSSFLNLQINIFDVKTYIYGDFNHNLRFMLKIQFKSIDSAPFINSYQVIISDPLHNSTTCIRIIERKQLENIDKYFKVERIFDLIIKDPPFISKPDPKFNFYFGTISVRPLISCVDENHERKYDLSGMCLIMSVVDKSIDAGIEKKPGSPDLDEFGLMPYRSNYDECKSRTVFGCTKIHFNNSETKDGQTIYTKNLIYIHKINPNVDEVTTQFGMHQKFHDSIISYQDETMYNLIFKVVDNIDQWGASGFNHLLLNSKLSANLTCSNSNYRCICDNKCAKCAQDMPGTTYVNINVQHYDSNCDSDIYSVIALKYNTYKTMFLDHIINTTTELHLYDSYPKLCYLTKYNENIYDRNSDTQLRDIDIKLRDLAALTYNGNFDIKYQIRLYEFCESSNSSDNIRVVSNVLFDSVINDPIEPVKLSSLILPGYYAIEMTPIVNSTYCKESLCPYQKFSRKINSNKIVCEPCTKIVFYLNIREDETDMSDYKCLDSRNYLTLKSFENAFSYSSNENSLHVSQNNYLFNINYSLVINNDVTVVFPDKLVNKYKCMKISKGGISGGTKPIIPIIIQLGILAGSLIICLFVVLVLFIPSVISKFYEKTSTPIKVLIILPKGLKELTRDLDVLVNLVQRRLGNIKFQVFGLSDIVDIDYLIEEYETSKQILFFCNNQFEIEKLHAFDKMNFPIGQDYGDDAKYVLLSNSEFNRKLRLITFYQKEIFSSLENFQYSHYELPSGFSKLLKTLIIDHLNDKDYPRGCKQIIESYLFKLYSSYIKWSINKEYEKIQIRNKYDDINSMNSDVELDV